MDDCRCVNNERQCFRGKLLTSLFIKDDEVDHKKQKTENGSNGAAAEEDGEEEEDAEEEEDIDGEEEEDVEGEGEEDLDEEEGGEGETICTIPCTLYHEFLHIFFLSQRSSELKVA